MGSKSKGRKTQKKPIQQAGQARGDSRSRVLVQKQTLEERSGPIPSPDDLERYSQIITDGADRIMALAESQTEHRHQLEQKIVVAQIADANSDRTERLVGQIFALIIGLTAIVSGAIVASKGQPWPGAIIGGSAIVGLVSVFIVGRKSEQDDKGHE